MDVERLGRAEPVDVPDLVDEPLAAHDGAGLAHEQGEEVELLARELQRLAVERHGARRRVELDGADLQRAGRRGGRGGARAAQDGADAGDELARAERLDDVVVGAELEAQHAVGLVAAGGEHDHRHALAVAQLAQQVEARAVGEHDVEEHEVGALAAGDLEPGRQRAGRLRAEALASEGFRQRNGDRLFVLDEQHHPRLGVHALIVGGLARCATRFSRPRGDRGRRRRAAAAMAAAVVGAAAAAVAAAAVAAGVVGSAPAVVAALAGARPRAAGAVVATAAAARWRWPARSSRRVAFASGLVVVVVVAGTARVVGVLGLVARAGDVLGGPGGGDRRQRCSSSTPRQGQRVAGDGQRRGRAPARSAVAAAARSRKRIG